MNRPQRNTAIVWRHEAGRERELLAAQQQGEDISEGGTVILVHQGTMHQLNLLGGEIWLRCDGERSLEQIINELAGEYEVDRGELEQDVRDFVADLEQRGWLIDG
ncbi:pyrroloquinoline quinone biosynthesis peptide chaperone PqqD [Geothermobacter hydrogeniphilus]|uniref:Pyrroloquinoline quinone biosynthesis peptide chaperone PqqD n=1 Tax=Geothermobacter hydrogeniphilus TaxID=1969733 RepID=A0A2K2H9A2_9BACT|nr:pyrroloquinoline quinone biosynthesis peptide chaperone PqqD [Geothermobacter hydrogeniphilus]PNU19905.1 pyrroloquinoline quinone biosynthesis peptide chaperone PqqD [Geothermobacter hydrogeniphilus]